MLCYRCGSHVPDTAESCPTCGQKLAGGGVRQATATFSRRKLATGQIEGAPYKAGDTIGTRYNIKDIVGMGPVGYVFRARDAEVDVDVALKAVNPRLVQTAEERRQFQKAIRLGRKLAHPNIVRVYEDGEEKDWPFFTMQYVEGLTLRKIIDLRISKGSFFTLREVEPILAQICSALDSAHKLGPHADLRPENIVVLPDLLKVTDYGLGLAIPRIPFIQALKAKKGDRYFAPEFLSGGEMDHRADIYSAAVIVGEMLTGLTPDGGLPELQRRNPEVPHAMEGLYRKALNTNPLARPKTAGAFYEEFAEITRRTSPPPLKPKPEPISAVPSASRPRPPTVSMAALEPRRKQGEKPPPPVPEDVEREPTMSDVKSLPGADETQPVDQTMLPLPPLPPADSEATQLVPTVLPPPPPPDVSREHAMGEETGRAQALPSRRNYWVILLWVGITLAGAGLGSVAGWWFLQRLKPKPVMPDRPLVVEEQTPPVDAGIAVAIDTDAAAKKAALERQAEEQKKLAAEQKAAEDKRLADEQKKAEEQKKLAEAEAEKKRLEEEKKKNGSGTKVVAAVGEGGCQEGMRFVPAGAFKMGTSGDDPMRGFDERNLASVDVPGFCVDVYEFPNKRGSSPTVNVSWNDAKRLCEGRGKRLCSEAEWEKACKGPGNARFPYGNQFDPNACNTEDDTGEDRTLTGAGRFAKCRSGYGIADLSGNVAEWTSTPYAANADKTQKGGSFDRPDYAARCSARKNGSPNARSGEVGFRCCSDATQ